MSRVKLAAHLICEELWSEQRQPDPDQEGGQVRGSVLYVHLDPAHHCQEDNLLAGDVQFLPRNQLTNLK